MGKFIQLILNSIGKIVESFALKSNSSLFVRRRQQTPSEKESFVRHQENENLQLVIVLIITNMPPIGAGKAETHLRNITIFVNTVCQ